MKTKTIKAALAFVGVLAMLAVLGAVGGIERGMIGVLPGGMMALVALGVCGACVEIEGAL